MLELPGDIATWLPFGVTVGAIALAAGLALVVLVMRLHTDRLLRRADEKTRAAEAQYQREEAIVSQEPGALYVWQSGGAVDEPRTRSGAANLLAGCLEGEEGDSLKDAIGSLNAQGSLFSLTIPGSDGETVIDAVVPVGELNRYAVDLRALTGGAGRFATEPAGYDVLPAHLAPMPRGSGSDD